MTIKDGTMAFRTVAKSRRLWCFLGVPCSGFSRYLVPSRIDTLGTNNDFSTLVESFFGEPPGITDFLPHVQT